MLIGGRFVEIALVYVVGPDGVERRRVPGHPRHERGDQRAKPNAQQPRREETNQHHRRGQIVIEDSLAISQDGISFRIILGRNNSLTPSEDGLCLPFGNGLHTRWRRILHLGNGNDSRDHSRQNHKKREKHLGNGSD